jgi:hypothetical protein
MNRRGLGQSIRKGDFDRLVTPHTSVGPGTDTLSGGDALSPSGSVKPYAGSTP